MSAPLWSRTFFILGLASGIVLFEPAPFDIAVALIAIATIRAGLLDQQLRQSALFSLLMMFLLVQIISTYMTVIVAAPPFRFLGITVYLVLTALVFFALIAHMGTQISTPFLTGMSVCAVVTATASLATLAFGTGLSDVLVYQDVRIKGLFKDPNVFAPYCVPATLLCLAPRHVFPHFYPRLVGALILVIANVVSASRAAWINLVFSLVAFYSVAPRAAPLSFSTIRVPAAVLVGASAIFLLLISYNESIIQLLAARAMLQEYDTERFQAQTAGLLAFLDFPLGVGPGQSDILLGYTPHSLYVRLLVENGYLGLLLIALTIGTALGAAFQANRTAAEDDVRFTAQLVFASLLGVLANSFFIDTLHWRHLWHLVAIGGGLAAASYLKRPVG